MVSMLFCDQHKDVLTHIQNIYFEEIQLFDIIMSNSDIFYISVQFNISFVKSNLTFAPYTR